MRIRPRCCKQDFESVKIRQSAQGDELFSDAVEFAIVGRGIQVFDDLFTQGVGCSKSGRGYSGCRRRAERDQPRVRAGAAAIFIQSCNCQDPGVSPLDQQFKGFREASVFDDLMSS